MKTLRVAKITRVRGLKGEVFLYPLSDQIENRLQKGNVLFTETTNKTLTVRSHSKAKNLFTAKFDEITNINDAETLRDEYLLCECDDETPDEWYLCDLVGLSVLEQVKESDSESSENIELGKVVSVIDRSMQDLLEVKLNDGKKVLIPFVAEMVLEVDIENGFILVSLPEGLISVQ